MSNMCGPCGRLSANPATKQRKDKAPVAQLDRVLGYEPSGREFESLRARQMTKGPQMGALFHFVCLDPDEKCCSTKRASVLDAAGAPTG